MINPSTVAREALFVPPWQAMVLVAVFTGFVGAIMIKASHHDQLVTAGASCTVTEVKATEGGDILGRMLCGNEAVETRKGSVLLAILRANAERVICDIYADRSVKDCKIPG